MRFNRFSARRIKGIVGAVWLLIGMHTLAAAPLPTWENLCYLLKVKVESKVFRGFRSDYELREFHKRKGSFSGRGGMMVECVGDDIVRVGVRVSDHSIRPPFGLTAKDDAISAAKKAGFELSDEQKKKENWDYLEVIDSKRGLVFYFMNGRLFEVWKEKPGRRAED